MLFQWGTFLACSQPSIVVSTCGFRHYTCFGPTKCIVAKKFRSELYFRFRRNFCSNLVRSFLSLFIKIFLPNLFHGLTFIVGQLFCIENFFVSRTIFPVEGRKVGKVAKFTTFLIFVRFEKFQSLKLSIQQADFKINFKFDLDLQFNMSKVKT